MKKTMKRTLALFTLALLLVSMVYFPPKAQAASEFYGDYTDVAAIKDYGSCPGMQGLAVGSQMLYTIKVDSSDTYSFISMTDKDSGSTSKLYNVDEGSYYFSYLNHANDMDVWGFDGYSHLFVATTREDSYTIVRLKRDGTNLTRVGNYSLSYNGSATWCSALAIESVSGGKITFLTKLGMEIFRGSISSSATSGDIALTKVCELSKSKVYIKGEYLDLSTFVNQGMGYNNGVLYVPISGDDNWLERSVIMVFNLDGAKGIIYPSEAIVFRVTSGTYSALFEIESCGVASDGKLYFNANRRKTDSDTNHDMVASFDGYTFTKLTEPAKFHHYVVQYEANGGSGTMEDTIVPYGVSTKLGTNTFTRSGYQFAGWTAYRTTKAQWYYTDGSDTGWYAEGSEPSGWYKYTYQENQSVAKTTSVDGDVVKMYTQWEPSTYTVTYNANGGSGTMENTTVTYGVNTNLRLNTFTKSGSTFKGWYAYRTAQDQWYYTNGLDSSWYTEGSEPSGYTKALYSDGVAVARTTGVHNDVVIMYAQWESADCTATFMNYNGTVLTTQTVTAGSVPTAPADPTRPADSSYHYTFSGWSPSVGAVNTDTTYTATFTATAHTFTGKITTAPTCSTPGVKTYSCSCGYSYTESVTGSDHTYVGKVTVAPTCTSQGTKTYTCSGCGTSYTEAIAASGHNYTSAVTKPTCNAQGYTTYTCTVCKASYKDQYTTPTGHSYSAKITQAATCTAAGVRTYTCTSCSASYTESIPANGHTMSQGLCSVCGYKDSSYVAPDFYLFGYINGGNYACEEDAANPGIYKFVNGKLTATFTSDSYVAVKAGDNSVWYMTEGWQGTDVTSVTLYDTNSLFSADKLFVPGNVTLTFTLTENSDGSLTLSYTQAAEAPSTEPTVSLKYPTVSFEDMILMNVYYDAENTQDVDEMGLVTYAAKPAAASVATADEVVPGYAVNESDGYYFSTTAGIAPKDLGDTIYFAVYYKLKDGTYGYTGVVGYSPKTYALSQLNNGSAQMKALVVAMLNYGAAAQTYFGYKTDSLMNATLTSAQKALVTSYNSNMVTTVTQASGSKLGEFINDSSYTKRYPTISFEGAFGINYYFQPSETVTGDVTMYMWSLEDFNSASVLTRANATKSVKMTLTETGEYLAVLDGIAAKDLDKAAYVTFVYSDGTTQHCGGVIGYTIGLYCKSQASKTGTLAELSKSCAVYGYYAKQLFG